MIYAASCLALGFLAGPGMVAPTQQPVVNVNMMATVRTQKSALQPLAGACADADAPLDAS